MPEYKTKEMKTRLVDQEVDAGHPVLEASEIGCLDIRQAPAIWRVSEDEKISDQNLHTFFALPLQPGQKVYCRDGYAGKIIALRIDPQGNVQDLVVQLGRFFLRRLIVPFEWVDRIEAESVYLSAKKDDLKSRPKERPDSTLVIEVERAMWDDVVLRRIANKGIHVTASCGIIVLEGYISNSALKARAEEAARQVSGVLGVENHLVVDEDLKIAAALAVAQDPHTRGDRIFVGAHNGFINLNGEVFSEEARMAAEERAGNVPQVRGVLNTLRVPGVEIEFEEQRALQPEIGAQVYATDIALGFVEQVIVNPVNRLVVAMLVNGQFPDPNEIRARWFPDDGALVHRRMVIPVRAIRHLTDTAVFLEIESTEAAKYEDLGLAGLTLPESGWCPPYPYHRKQVLIWNQLEANPQLVSVPIQFEQQEV